MSNTQAIAQVKNANQTKTTTAPATTAVDDKALVNQQTADAQQPATTGVETMNEQPTAEAATLTANDAKQYALLLAMMLKVTVDDLEKIAYYCFMNKEVLIEKLKLKGLQKTWAYVLRKTGVNIKDQDITNVLQLGITTIIGKIVEKLKSEHEEMGQAFEEQAELVMKAYKKAFAKDQNYSTAVSKAVAKISFMGFEGKTLLAKPTVANLLESLDVAIPSPKAVPAKRWEPGSMSRAITTVVRRHNKAK